MLCNEIISSWAIIHDLNELSNAIGHLAIYGIDVPEILVKYALAWISADEDVRLSVSCVNETYANVYLRRVSNGKLIRRAKIVRRAK